MSLLNITKVLSAGEQCWGIVLLDERNLPILRSEKGVRKGEVTSIAKALKFEGPGAPVVLADKATDSDGLALGDREDGSRLVHPLHGGGRDIVRLAAQGGRCGRARENCAFR